MKKLMYVLHGLASGGTEAFVLNVVSALDKNKYDITFVLALDDNQNTFQFREQEALDMGIKIYRTCDLENPGKWMIHYQKLKEILLKEGPFDIIHCNMDLFNAINLLAARKVGVPIRICHSHNSKSQYATNLPKKIAVTCYRFIMRKIIKRNATLMLGCSEIANTYLYGKNWTKDSRCHILYNGIDMKRFTMQSRPKRNVKKIMTVGRFINQKNPFYLLGIINELAKLRDDFVFQWVGDGMLKSEIEQMTKDLGLTSKIQFLGVRKDIPELMADNDYFLFPSLFEGLPITLIEAQVSGLHCFISDTITEEVDLNLCERYSIQWDCKEWASKISYRMDNPQKDKINEDKRNQFNVAETVKRLEEYYG